MKIAPATGSECYPGDNNESSQEISNSASIPVTIEDIVQNEVILDDASVEPVNSDEHSKEGTDPFVDILAPDDLNCNSDKESNPKDDTESEDEYVYMSDDPDKDCDVPYENNDLLDQLSHRPGPKSKTRNIQCVPEPSREDQSAATLVAEEKVRIDLDEDNRTVCENNRIERRSTRNATKLITYEIDSLFAAQIEQSQNLRPKKSLRNNVQFRKDAIQAKTGKVDKDLFETPLNA